MKRLEFASPGSAVFDTVCSVISFIVAIINFALDDWNAAIFFLLVALWFK